MEGYLRNAHNPDLDRYLLSVLPDRDPVLREMEAYAIDRKFPFIGPLAGELLSLLARCIGAKRVLEMGSGFGFSAVHFARALPADGRVICTDGDPVNERTAREFFSKAKVADKIEYHVGDAIEIVKRLSGPFDVVLMDIDKEGYPDGFRAAWPKIRPGGLFIADNLLWHGRVMSADDQMSTRGVRELTQLLYSTPQAQTTIVPLRDGISITLKLS